MKLRLKESPLSYERTGMDAENLRGSKKTSHPCRSGEKRLRQCKVGRVAVTM